MDIRMLVRSDVDTTAELCARRMADDDYFREKYLSRRADDRTDLEVRLRNRLGDILPRAVGYGTSLGAFEGGKLVGACACFWYDSAKEYDRPFFDKVFAPKGELLYGETLHGRLSREPGAVLYCMALSTEKEYANAASRMMGTVMARQRPGCVAAACTDAWLPFYEKLGAVLYELDEGLFLAIC